jgi:hypothetical protein
MEINPKANTNKMDYRFRENTFMEQVIHMHIITKSNS